MRMLKLGWLELEAWLLAADLLDYTTVKGNRKMAPLRRDQIVGQASLFLGRAKPYGCYVIRYSEGPGREAHVDDGVAHERAIFSLKNADRGGQLLVLGLPVDLQPGDGVVYRADLYKHSVTPIEKGERIVLTLGKVAE